MSWGLLFNFRIFMVHWSSVCSMLHRTLLLNVKSLVLKRCLLDLGFHWLVSVKASLIGFFSLVFLILAMIGVKNLWGCEFFTLVVLVGRHMRFFFVWSKPNLWRCVVLGLDFLQLCLFTNDVVGTLLLLCPNMIKVIKFVLILTDQVAIWLLILRIDVVLALMRNTSILETFISISIKLCLRFVTLWFLWVNQKLALRIILMSFFRLKGIRDTILDSWTESIFTWLIATFYASSW